MKEKYTIAHFESCLYSLLFCNRRNALQIYADLGEFQKKYLKENSQPVSIDVPKCFFTKYKSGAADANTADTSSPEPPESILVLQDMRPLGFKVCVKKITSYYFHLSK